MTVNGINFKNNTNKEVVSILSQKIKTQERIRLWYGDPKTGEAHLGDYNIIGYVNYTTGKVKVPILVYNARSRGGILVRTDEILKITHNKEILYQHPLFHLPKMEIIDNYIFVNGKIYAKFDTREKAQNYISFQKGETNRLM